MAAEIIESIKQGGYSEESFVKLCNELEGEEPPDSFERFAIWVEGAATFAWCDSELVAHLDCSPQEVTDELRVSFMRERLLSELESPTEDTPSLHWEEVRLPSDDVLYCCALVHIEGYSPVISWYGAFNSLSNFYGNLVQDGYVTCETDVKALGSEWLLSYWERSESI